MKTRYTHISISPVIDGVLVRSRSFVTIAVRAADQKILIRSYPQKSWLKRFSWATLPLIRGVVISVESLLRSIEAIGYSVAVLAGDRQSEAPRANVSALLGVFSALIAGIFVFAVLPETVAAQLPIPNAGLGYLLSLGFIKAAFIVVYLLLLTSLGPVTTLLGHKGAAHAALKVFNQNQDFTLEKAKLQSPYYLRGLETQMLVSLLLAVVLINVFFPLWGWNELFGNPVLNQSALLLLKIFLVMPVMSLVYEIQHFFAAHHQQPLIQLLLFPFYLFQSLLVRKGNDSQLEIALVALRQVLRLEKGIPSPLSQASLDGSETGDEEFEIASMNDLGRVRIDVNDFLEN